MHCLLYNTKFKMLINNCAKYFNIIRLYNNMCIYCTHIIQLRDNEVESVTP